MEANDRTLDQTLGELKETLKSYIEATYHVRDESIVAKRLALLDEPGVISQEPFIESTPRYSPGMRFEQMGLEDEVSSVLSSLASLQGDLPRRLFNPPYAHQAEALALSHHQHKSLVVMTGTGSGKTETFLLPILSRLLRESSKESWPKPAVRALVLYPMNALVNDQVGRLRLLMGDPRFASSVMEMGGRPARFAKYTSRTPYPGVRTPKRDRQRLKPIADFYVGLLKEAREPGPEGTRAQTLIRELQQRGKWPAKPDFEAWFGSEGTHYQDSVTNAFKRAITRSEDIELFTRHEVLETPPDVLVTNYSMLEYMLMRPLERPVFDATRQWLAEFPDEHFLLVIDEAHLYRGSSGAEVSLLVRRLRDRLGIESDRLDVICTSASFSDSEAARSFAAQLSGKDVHDFESISGDKAHRTVAGPGTDADVAALCAVDLGKIHASGDDVERIAAASSLFQHLGAVPKGTFEEALLGALSDYAPLGLAINETMDAAFSIPELAAKIFPTAQVVEAKAALTALLTLGSMAKKESGDVPLFPARAHMFFRGLAGLWACLNQQCPESPSPTGISSSPIGKLFSQPRERCDECDSLVLELFTCRNCGTAYGRGYTANVESPRYVSTESGGRFKTGGGEVSESFPLDICLESPTPGRDFELIQLDLLTGEVNPPSSDAERNAYIRGTRLPSDGEQDQESLGRFLPCCVCGDSGTRNRGTVQDHQTKGDQPFQALVTTQIQVQTPGLAPATEFAPLRGRKVLLFSDSRQMAARLAPHIQAFSERDAIRPTLFVGLQTLAGISGGYGKLTLDDAYLALLVGARQLGLRLRPNLSAGELFRDPVTVNRAFRDGTPSRDDLADLRQEVPGGSGVPQSLLIHLYSLLTQRYYSVADFALGFVRPRDKVLNDLLEDLPPLAGFETENARRSLVLAWTHQWTRGDAGVWLRGTPNSWWQGPRSETAHGVLGHGSGKFKDVLDLLADKSAKKTFETQWLPVLLANLCEQTDAKYRLLGSKTCLEPVSEWAYCQICRSTQPVLPGIDRCLSCGDTHPTVIDPDTDPVFQARKGFYRNPTIRALADNSDAPVALQAAEHTAQLNSAESTDVFSRAEIYELLFQDVEIPSPDGGAPSTAIDLLSSTTTMEVGIDIGALSGVALRNMPPSRPSYQQRAGRAGRRGSAIATVVAYGSVDSHDDHYFSHPRDMIRGAIIDPSLTLDNTDIAWRHVMAWLLQNYHQDRLEDLSSESDSPYGHQLFEVLGSVSRFLDPTATLNRFDFERWVAEQPDLRVRLDAWLPTEIPSQDRTAMLESFAMESVRRLDAALDFRSNGELNQAAGPDSPPGEPELESEEEEAEQLLDNDDLPTDRQAVSDRLLDRLLYKGVLPRYAFPTDVASFYVFDAERSTRYKRAHRYAPSQSLQVALTQYAPGKEVVVDSNEWYSGALYSVMDSERADAWQRKRLYLECRECGYAMTVDPADLELEIPQYQLKGLYDCPACHTHEAFGKAMNWIRPPGFAHPVDQPVGSVQADVPATSYATRAKLIESGPADSSEFLEVTTQLRHVYRRSLLVVSNSGPNGDGYDYCVWCGRIAPSAQVLGNIRGPHPKPTPAETEPMCEGRVTRNLVLGMDFHADVLLSNLKFEGPVRLTPGHLATQIALRSASEALVRAGTELLQLDSTELAAEFRPALSGGGPSGREAEIYLYDTLSGGAGFTRRLQDHGAALYEEAVRLLDGCPDGCDRSCYRCLRQFGNRFEHDRLDRFMGADVLRHVLTGAIPMLSKARENRALELLEMDLGRRADLVVTRNAEVLAASGRAIEVPLMVESGGRAIVIAVHHPLTPRFVADPDLSDLKEFGPVPVLPVDELVVTRNLPAASGRVLEALGLA